MWVLGIEPRSSGRVVSALNCRAISLALISHHFSVSCDEMGTTHKAPLCIEGKKYSGKVLEQLPDLQMKDNRIKT